jgi:hypothetical protein
MTQAPKNQKSSKTLSPAGRFPVFHIRTTLLFNMQQTLPSIHILQNGILSYLTTALKENNACTDIICSDLGIIGSEDGAPDYTTLTPKLTLTMSGNKVETGWGWQGHGKFLDQCELQVDRGTGYQVLTFDITPGYTDSTPFPATLTELKYRAIYGVVDAQVGQWSAEVSIAVGE